MMLTWTDSPDRNNLKILPDILKHLPKCSKALTRQYEISELITERNMNLVFGIAFACWAFADPEGVTALLRASQDKEEQSLGLGPQ